MHREPGLLETGDAALNELTLERQFERNPSKTGRVHGTCYQNRQLQLSRVHASCVNKGGTVEKGDKAYSIPLPGEP